MSVRCTEPRGFTLVELVAVLLLLGVLAAVALPRLAGLGEFRSDAWRGQALAGLRLAAATAVGHRRLVCASFAADGKLSLSVASGNPATSCASSLPGPDGSSSFAEAAGTGVSVTPAGTLYFQPNGRVSRDGAGLQVANRSITASGMPAITVYGESGHAE